MTKIYEFKPRLSQEYIDIMYITDLVWSDLSSVLESNDLTKEEKYFYITTMHNNCKQLMEKYIDNSK